MFNWLNIFDAMQTQPQFFQIEPNKINVHANAMYFQNHAIIIFGKSGSGKTSFCQALIEKTKHLDVASQWIADDRLLLQAQDNSIMLCAPENLLGLAETRPKEISVICDVWQGWVTMDKLIFLELISDEIECPITDQIVFEKQKIAIVQLPSSNIEKTVKWLVEYIHAQIQKTI